MKYWYGYNPAETKSVSAGLRMPAVVVPIDFSRKRYRLRYRFLIFYVNEEDKPGMVTFTGEGGTAGFLNCRRGESNTRPTDYESANIHGSWRFSNNQSNSNSS